MISATRAREIYELSEPVINNLIDKIGKHIEDTASQHKRILELGFISELTLCEPYLRNPSTPPLVIAVMEKLKFHGYTVKFGKIGESYVPGTVGFRARDIEDVEDKTPHYNYAITVSF